jgi:hypothetical protein
MLLAHAPCMSTSKKALRLPAEGDSPEIVVEWVKE